MATGGTSLAAVKGDVSSPPTRKSVARIAVVASSWATTPHRRPAAVAPIWCWWWFGSGAYRLVATRSGLTGAGSSNSLPSWTGRSNLFEGLLSEHGRERS